MFVRAKLQLSETVKDLDLWAVNLIESNSLSPTLENGWWWCTWPDHVVELFFDVSSDIENVEIYKTEVNELTSIEKINVKTKSISITKDVKSNT